MLKRTKFVMPPAPETRKDYPEILEAYYKELRRSSTPNTSPLFFIDPETSMAPRPDSRNRRSSDPIPVPTTPSPTRIIDEAPEEPIIGSPKSSLKFSLLRDYPAKEGSSYNSEGEYVESIYESSDDEFAPEPHSDNEEEMFKLS